MVATTYHKMQQSVQVVEHKRETTLVSSGYTVRKSLFVLRVCRRVHSSRFLVPSPRMRRQQSTTVSIPITQICCTSRRACPTSSAPSSQLKQSQHLKSPSLSNTRVRNKWQLSSTGRFPPHGPDWSLLVLLSSGSLHGCTAHTRRRALSLPLCAVRVFQCSSLLFPWPVAPCSLLRVCPAGHQSPLTMI